MLFLLFSVGLLITVALSFVFAAFMSQERTAKSLNKDMQVWAFGEILAEETPLCQIPMIWNKKNPEKRFHANTDPWECVRKIKHMYKEHKNH